MNRLHSLSAARFDALASGDGDPAAIESLRAAQLSKHTLLLHAVVETAHRDHPRDAAVADLRSSYHLLTTVQQRAPAVIAGILLHPQVGAWAAHCLGRLRGTRRSSAPLWVDLCHLGAIAATAALQAGIDGEVTVALRDGTVMLPMLGMAATGRGRPWSTSVLRLRTNRVELMAGETVTAWPRELETDSSEWLALRRLDITVDDRRIEVFLEDLDPFRNCYDLPPAPRLDALSVGAWHRSMGEAWSLLVRHHRDRAAEIAVALTSVVPLEKRRGTRSASAASSDAFGAIASTMPLTGQRLAATLVHEVQHLKLDALVDMFTLYEDEGAELYYSPWRDDPRPLGSLLQGTFAHLALADYWLRQRHYVTGGRAMLGHFEFARCRDQCSDTARRLGASGRLTELGVRFVGGIRATLGAWRQEAVPDEAAELARDAVTDHRLTWRLRNLRSDPDAVKLLGEAWAAGGRCPDLGLPPTNVIPPTRTPDHGRLELVYARLDDPGRFQRLVQGRPRPHDELPATTSADLADARGDHDRAVDGYVAEIADHPDDPARWAGLALALSHAARDLAATALLTCPELVFDLHREVRQMTDTAPDPLALSRWLARLCPPTTS